MGEGGLNPLQTLLPIFPPGLKLVQMDAEHLEPEKDWLGASIRHKPETNWKLQNPTETCTFFSRQEYDAKDSQSHTMNILDVKGTQIKVLQDLVPMFSASGRTTLCVHACTADVQFE